jgi:hypothetical protein
VQTCDDIDSSEESNALSHAAIAVARVEDFLSGESVESDNLRSNGFDHCSSRLSLMFGKAAKFAPRSKKAEAMSGRNATQDQ